MPDKKLGEGLGRLTSGERLLIDRRRRTERQEAAALRLGVSRAVYGAWERETRSDGPPVKIGRLKVHERCLLYRRRVGCTQAAVADGLRCSRFWVNLMEQGRAPCDDLLWYWEQ